MNYKSTAFFTSFVLDGVLQNLPKKILEKWKLKEYFRRHGAPESMILAGGTAWFGAYIDEIVNPTHSIISSFAVGFALDIIWRTLNIYSTLKPFYKSKTVIDTGTWSGIALALPALIIRKFGQ